jgi:hypothetical protein
MNAAGVERGRRLNGIRAIHRGKIVFTAPF